VNPPWMINLSVYLAAAAADAAAAAQVKTD